MEQKEKTKRQIQYISRIIYEAFSHEYDGREIHLSNTEEVASQIISEVFGKSTVGLDDPVDEELNATVSDMLAQIRARQAAKDAQPQPKGQSLTQHGRTVTLGDIQNLSNTKAFIIGQDEKDPFDEAMKAVEKK